MDEQVKKLMKNLGITEAQAKQVIADDKAIDKGEKLFELTDEQKKVAKKMTITEEHKKTAYKFDKRERKQDNTKRELIQKFETLLAGMSAECITVLNPEREIEFKLDGKKYKITLSCPRG